VAQQPAGGADLAKSTHRALCHLARRHQALTAELAALNADLVALARQAAPRLLARCGIGIETAGQLLVTAGTTPTGSTPTPPWPRCAAPVQWRPPRARPSAIG
jgi:hypothetical protein